MRGGPGTHPRAALHACPPEGNPRAHPYPNTHHRSAPHLHGAALPGAPQHRALTRRDPHPAPGGHRSRSPPEPRHAHPARGPGHRVPHRRHLAGALHLIEQRGWAATGRACRHSAALCLLGALRISVGEPQHHRLPPQHPRRRLPPRRHPRPLRRQHLPVLERHTTHRERGPHGLPAD
ncbi:DUF6197 family protein [Streptomyces microflavus]